MKTSKRGDLQQEISLIEEMLSTATARYRELAKQHLALRGSKRKAHKPRLHEAKDYVWELEKRLAKAKCDALKLKLAESQQGARQQSKLRKELAKWETRYVKLLSRLDHDEWLEFTRSVWPFKDTESTAKTGLHPAQFSAVIPYRAIKMYSYVDEIVLDPFVGTGTTLLEARKLGRHSIGLDINPEFLELARRRLENESLVEQAIGPGGESVTFVQPALLEAQSRYIVDESHLHNYKPVMRLDDARKMQMVEDNSIDLIVTHPPYWNAVQISELDDDLSNVGDDQYDYFLSEMGKVFDQFRRVLKPDRVAVIVIGDVMRKVNGITQLFPIHSDFIQLMKDRGFVTWDVFIWETKIRKSGGKPVMGSYPYPHKLFSQFAHNYVLVFRKLHGT